MADGKTLEKGDWHLPATMLNILWSDVYPRMLANIWRGDKNWFPHSDYSYKTRNWLAIAADDGSPVQEEAKGLLEDRHTFGATTPEEYDRLYDRNVKEGLKRRIDDLIALAAARRDEAGKVDPSRGVFEQRALRLKAYLDDPHAVPIRIIDHDAYDFLLSRDGVEFFKPEQPQTPEALLQRYTIRTTGRLPLGLPALFATNGGGDGHVDLVQIDTPDNPGLIVSRPERQDTAADESDELFKQRHLVRRDHEADDYWQIPGGVYRAIVYETPRVVATIWYHHYAGSTSEDGYQARYGSRADSGLRDIFEERLELTLPPSRDMRYFSPPSAGGTKPYETLGSWISQEINIVRAGFFFPELLEEDKAPDLDSMLSDIAAGTAGNPVITSSVGGPD